jgi:hypothetical protein
MLHAQDVIVADEAEVTYQVFPKLVPMSVTNRTEDPGSIDFIGIGFRVKQSILKKSYITRSRNSRS